MTPARRLVLIGALYLSQGLPFGFFEQALPALLRSWGASLPQISLTSLLALPWALKFLWAPVVDRCWSPRLGRRRSWLLPLQALTVLALLGLATQDPDQGLMPLLVGFLVMNLLAATQDIATDGLATELLPSEERGLGNGLQVGAYRVGMILGGGLLLMIYDQIGWKGAMVAMAAVVALASLPALRFEEGSSAQRSPLSGPSGLLRRSGALPWMAFLFTWKFGEAMGKKMFTPLLVDAGLDLGDIGSTIGLLGFGAGLVGAFAGGALVNPLGRLPALLLTGLLQSLAIAAWALAPGQTEVGALLLVLIAAEHLCGGMATSALFTLMMDACGEENAGTDYTLQASVVVFSTGLAAALAGQVAERWDYGPHFLLSGLLSALALLPALWAWRRGGFELLRR